MAGALFARIKTWSAAATVIYSDLNAEFDNILNNLMPQYIDDYSANSTQMRVTTDPGEVGTESLATTLSGELERLRHIIKEVTGEDKWYESPVSSLLGLSNAIGTGLTANRLVSGRVLSTSAQPAFLVPHGAARTVTVDGTPTNFIYYIDGVEYTISTDVTLTGLTAAPSSNNTCAVNDVNWSAQYWTKYMGEDGSEIPVDAMGTEISALVGKFAAFKLVHAAATEYFFAYVKSTTSLTKARRGYFFSSADAAIPRLLISDNDVITLMKATWVFAKTDGTLTATYTNPVWSDDEPTSPAIGDYWFDSSANTWKVYGVGSFSAANAVLVGMCIQDTSNTVAARSFEFFKNYESANTIELFAESNSQVKSRFPGGIISVWGTTIKNDYNIHTWDMTLDLDSGVTESASTYYYFYLTETGDKIISDKKPHDRGDLFGQYHPSQSWRCVGWAFNNGSSNLEQVESYYRTREAQPLRSVIATDYLLSRDRIITLSGASFTDFLPDSALCKGQIYTFIHSGTSLSQVYTLDGFSTQTIGGSTTVAMHTNGQVLRIIADGSNWLILDSKTSNAWTSYTPVPAGFGTCTNMEMFWTRMGENMRVRGSFLSGVSAAASPTIPLPTGAVLATTKMSLAKRMSYGTWIGSITTTVAQLAATTRGPWAVTTDDAVTDSVLLCQDVDKDNDAADQVFVEQAYTAMTDTASTSWQLVDFTVPISGWLP